jgi:hypothetical protein
MNCFTYPNISRIRTRAGPDMLGYVRVPVEHTLVDIRRETYFMFRLRLEMPTNS